VVAEFPPLLQEASGGDTSLVICNVRTKDLLFTCSCITSKLQKSRCTREHAFAQYLRMILVNGIVGDVGANRVSPWLAREEEWHGLALTVACLRLRRGSKLGSVGLMDLQNPIATSSTSRDPFELERLADELEAREHSIDAPAHDLPLYSSLAHNNSFFTATTFNVEDFLLSRVHTSLPDLRAELRDYLAVLKEELVQLINDDYEAFISLSTDLRGEGERLERLKLPLGDLKSQILVSSTPL
jgi:hypothetical protein